MNTALMHPMTRRRVTLRIRTWVDTFPSEPHVIEAEGDASVYAALKRRGADYLVEQHTLAEARNAEFQYRIDMTQEAL